MKKLASMIVAVSLMVSFVPSFANEKNEPIDTSKLELIQVESVPENVNPIVIDSQAEFDEFVKMVESQSVAENYDFQIPSEKMNSEKSSKTNQFEMMSNSTITTSTSETIGAFLYLNLYAQVGIYRSGSFGQINSINGWSSLTGYSPGIEWVQNYVSTNISSNKQSATVTAYGTVKHYLLIDGFVNIWNSDRSISLNYNL